MKLDLGKSIEVRRRRLYFNLWDDLRINLGAVLWVSLVDSLVGGLGNNMQGSLRFNLWESLKERG